jgi:hypothetical protein
LIRVAVLAALLSGCRAPEPQGSEAVPAAPAAPAEPSAPVPPPAAASAQPDDDRRAARQALFEALTPVRVSNCDFTRVGSANDGGYVMCGNLLPSRAGAYSYGIGGHDAWGCQISRRLRVPVHQYDCFQPPRLACDGGEFVPHDECVGARAETVDGRVFDTVASQIARNGDSTGPLLVKMDVEGAEWESLYATPDAVLARIDQLAMELHGTDDPRFLETVQKLKRHFYLVHIHFNNWACRADAAPFPALAYQVLFVNKRVATLGAPAPGRLTARDFDAPDNPAGPDCQLPPL